MSDLLTPKPLQLITPVATKKYSDLTHKVQIMVAEKLDRDMQQAYNVLGRVQAYKQILEQVNPSIAFYVVKDVPTHRIIDTKDNKLATILGKELAEYARFNPDLMNRVLTKIINK